MEFAQPRDTTSRLLDPGLPRFSPMIGRLQTGDTYALHLEVAGQGRERNDWHRLGSAASEPSQPNDADGTNHGGASGCGATVGR